MAKIEKTADELKNIIFDRIGVKATVRVHETRGWTATKAPTMRYFGSMRYPSMFASCLWAPPLLRRKRFRS
jgi:hypothetical protein